MPRMFSRDPSIPGRQIWTYPRGPAWFSVAALVLVTLVALGLAGAFAWTLVMLHQQSTTPTLADALAVVVLGCCVSFLILLVNHVARDLAGKWHGWIAITATHLELDLAAHRSLIHAPPRVQARIALGEIEAIESRLESWSNLGMGMMQRSYRLCSRNGNHILLFEQRALGTGFESTEMNELAQALARGAGVPLRDFGMVQGKVGFLGLFSGQEVDWNTPPLSAERQRTLWRRTALTGALPLLLVLASLVARAFA